MINTVLGESRGDRRMASRSHQVLRRQSLAFQEGLDLVARTRLSRLPLALVMTMIATAARADGSSGGTGVTGATGGAAVSQMLNNISTFILGAFGQSLAVLAIIGIGMAWMFGRVSLGLIAGVVGGIIIMFGASYIAETLTAG